MESTKTSVMQHTGWRYHIISYAHHIFAYSICAKYATSISKMYDMQKEETD